MLLYLIVIMVDVKQKKQTNREVTKIQQPTCLYSQVFIQQWMSIYDSSRYNAAIVRSYDDAASFNELNASNVCLRGCWHLCSIVAYLRGDTIKRPLLIGKVILNRHSKDQFVGVAHLFHAESVIGIVECQGVEWAKVNVQAAMRSKSTPRTNAPVRCRPDIEIIFRLLRFARRTKVI